MAAVFGVTPGANRKATIDALTAARNEYRKYGRTAELNQFQALIGTRLANAQYDLQSGLLKQNRLMRDAQLTAVGMHSIYNATKITAATGGSLGLRAYNAWTDQPATGVEPVDQI